MKKYSNSIKQACNRMKNLIHPKMQTEYHKKAWVSFDKTRIYRCILYTSLATFTKINSCIYGTYFHQLAYKFIKNEDASRNFDREFY